MGLVTLSSMHALPVFASWVLGLLLCPTSWCFCWNYTFKFIYKNIDHLSSQRIKWKYFLLTVSLHFMLQLITLSSGILYANKASLATSHRTEDLGSQKADPINNPWEWSINSPAHYSFYTSRTWLFQDIVEVMVCIVDMRKRTAWGIYRRPEQGKKVVDRT